MARLGIAPTFSASAVQAYSALTSSGGDVTSVHVVLRDLAGAIALDTVVVFPATSSTLTLELPVSIEGTTQDFNAVIELRDAAGVVQFSSTSRVTAHDQATGGSSPAVVTMQYVGPGFAAKSVSVSPAAVDVPTGGSQVLSASALDGLGKVVPDISVTWTTSDATIATVSSTGTSSAVVTSKGPRGPVTISATTQSGLVGKAVVNILPQPSRLVVISGAGQTAPAYKTLPNAYVVELDGTDGKPIANGVVNFRVIGSDGDVGTPLVATDANGRASTTMKLGKSSGTYTFEAASGTLAPVTVTETASAAVIGAPTQLIPLTGVPQSYRVGVSSPQTYSAQIADANGVSVPQAGIVITIQFTIQPGNISSSISATSNASGVVSFGSIPAFPAAGTLTVSITSSSPTMVNLPFGTFTITP